MFTNARRLAERLAASLNELAGEDLVRAHHGSLAREQRLEVEDALKEGRLRAIVATSSLELGIDMGAVDLVIQVESPGSVASGLQRIGRAGHQVGEPSRGRIFPKFRGDLLEAAVVAERMLAGEIEHTRYLRNPLDVLAQQLVAMCAVEERGVDELLDTVRRAAPFAELSKDVFLAVLDMLAGRYPSDGFAELRPRVVWDRAAGTVRARDGAGRIAITSGGTIPDRGLFAVFLADGPRVGELDEEMVYESRRGDVIVLGASAWRIEDITRDRVIVTPAPGEQGRMPFWHGDKPGRPIELGRAVGAFTRTLRGSRRDAALDRLRRDVGLDELAAGNLVSYLEEQMEATGAVPDDRTVVVERFRDEIGDWRMCVLSPFGSRVHAPWAMAIEARMLERFGPGRAGAVERRRHRRPAPRGRRPDPRGGPPVRPRRDRSRGRAGGAADGDVRERVPGGGGAGAPAPAAPPGAAHAPVAAAAAVGRPARRGVEVPGLPDPAGGDAGVPARRVRRPGAPRGDGRPPLAAHPARRRSTPSTRRRSPSRCCSGGSASTCTRATRRSPSGARPR